MVVASGSVIVEDMTEDKHAAARQLGRPRDSLNQRSHVLITAGW